MTRWAIVGLTVVFGCDRAPRDEPPTVERPTVEPPVVEQVDPFVEELRRAYTGAAPEPTHTRRFELRAAPTQTPLFDGQLVDVWAYEGRVPGPVLRVTHGEALEVVLHNELPQPTTIHWHGVRVPNAMDGVPGVTQDPVPPGQSFTYRFVPKDAGTFWFHPHVRGAEQVERGLYGVLVVEDAEPLPYSHDEVWVLDDWRLGPDGQIDPRFVTRHDLAHDGRWGRHITVNGDTAHELRVAPGERIRIRLVNTSNGRVYRPDFGRLQARVIAVDGMYTARPLPARGFELAPGNRLDVDVVIPDEGDFMVVDRFTRRSHVLVRVHAAGDRVETPSFGTPSSSRVPRWEGALDRPVDVTYRLNAQRGGQHGIEWTINGRTWETREPTALPAGQWVRLRFDNASARLHPMHVHGQFFRVLARNGQPVDEPFFRDTVLVHGREVVDVGMVPLDWGRWMMHCHVLEHAEAGMRTEIRVE